MPNTGWAHDPPIPLSPIPPHSPFFLAPVRQTIRNPSQGARSRPREPKTGRPYRTRNGNSCVLRYGCTDIRITVYTYTLLDLRTEVSTYPAGGNDEGGGSEF